jgi:hypothetical protein
MSRSLFARGKQPLRAAMLVFASCLMSINASTLLGQAQNTGTISGAVSDRSHAVIPGAVITLTSEDRGNVLTVKSNAQGDYTFNDVVTGNYTLQATAPGFATYISRHVQLDSDTRLRVDATLQAGDVQAQVEVTANSTTVDTQDATVGQVIDNELVENLPIEGNNVVALAALLPGVTDVSAPTTFTDENGGATFSANGSRVNSSQCSAKQLRGAVRPQRRQHLQCGVEVWHQHDSWRGVLPLSRLCNRRSGLLSAPRAGTAHGAVWPRDWRPHRP